VEEEAPHPACTPRCSYAGFSDWVGAIRALFEPLGGFDLPEIERETLRDPPDRAGPGLASET
jgi:hypothetical protein